MAYNPTTIKAYLKNGGQLVLNNYGYFDSNLLTLRIKIKWGRRLIRWDLDIDEVAEAAQNTIDMYKGYLQEIFSFPNEYKIINPLHEESTHTMTYSKTGEGSEDTNKNENTTTSGTSSTSGTSGEDGSFTDDFTHGETIKKEVSTHDLVHETDTTSINEQDNTEYSETVEGTTGDNKNGSTLTNVSAYNQTADYAPRDQVINTSTTSEENKEEKTGTSKTVRTGTDSVTIEKEGNGTVGETDTHSGTDKRKGTNKSIGTSSADTTTSGKRDTTGVINVKNNNSEDYNMNEKTVKDGRIKYEEIIDTLDNLFSPYDWLAEKIVKTICEVFYYI